VRRVDEVLLMFRSAGAGLVAAHAAGITHRDFKPANVLVGNDDRARVTDFGLAASAGPSAPTAEVSPTSRLTQTGAILGTPAYMAPEQRNGGVVDARSDQYCFCVALHEALFGALPPLQKVSARSLAPAEGRVPPRIRRAIARGLSRDPAERFPSLAALLRALEWDPRARRRQVLAALAALVIVAGFAIRAVMTAQRERARARLAEALGRDAKEIEWLLRSAYQLPLHDTTPERELIRARMQHIVARKHDLGQLGDATVHGALGRGHLALHEWPEAAAELAAAVALDAEVPGLHAARGRALGELYHRALDDARRSGDRTWLLARQKELERQYLVPALAELDRSRADVGSGDDAASLEALVALYRRDFALAEARAREVAARAPWLFEARKVAAEAVYVDAAERVDRGEYDSARVGLERATELYAAAIDVARSDDTVYEAAARAWRLRAEIEVRQGRSPRDALEHARAAVDNALIANPKNAPAYTTKADVLLRWYRTPALLPPEPRAFLDELAAVAARAVALDAHDATAWDALGNAHVYRGLYDDRHGADPTPSWQRALEELGQALAIAPNHPWANNDLGVLHRWIGTRQADHGQDPMAEFMLALHSYARASEFDPQYLFAFSNQADLEAAMSEYQLQHGRDPGPHVDGARRAGERCLAIDPHFSDALDSMAQAELVAAHFLMRGDGDPTASLGAARSDLSRALANRPGDTCALWLQIVAARHEASYLLRLGRDSKEALAKGRAAVAAALAAPGECPDCLAEAAQIDLLSARVAARPRAAALVEAALAKARLALAGDAHFEYAQLVAALACLRLAAARPDRAPRALSDGLGFVDAALALDPNHAEAHATRAALLLARQGPTSQAAAEAARAFALDPSLRREWGETLRAVSAGANQ
jgi:serine/threonine-protein kinase